MEGNARLTFIFAWVGFLRAILPGNIHVLLLCMCLKAMEADDNEENGDMEVDEEEEEEEENEKGKETEPGAQHTAKAMDEKMMDDILADLKKSQVGIFVCSSIFWISLLLASEEAVLRNVRPTVDELRTKLVLRNVRPTVDELRTKLVFTCLFCLMPAGGDFPLHGTCDAKQVMGGQAHDAFIPLHCTQPDGVDLSTATVKVKLPFLMNPQYQLREYQLIGMDWLNTMYTKDLNGILADEMGLGKTVMTIAMLANLACTKEIWGPHLIVVPTRCRFPEIGVGCRVWIFGGLFGLGVGVFSTCSLCCSKITRAWS